MADTAYDADHLRQAIAAKVANLYGYAYDADREITVTAGATQAILTALLAVVHPGDEVIVLEPAYDSYAPNIALAGGVMVPVPLDPANFRPDFDRIRAACVVAARHLAALVLDAGPGLEIRARRLRLTEPQQSRAHHRAIADPRACITARAGTQPHKKVAERTTTFLDFADPWPSPFWPRWAARRRRRCQTGRWWGCSAWGTAR